MAEELFDTLTGGLLILLSIYEREFPDEAQDLFDIQSVLLSYFSQGFWVFPKRRKSSLIIVWEARLFLFLVILKALGVKTWRFI